MVDVTLLQRSSTFIMDLDKGWKFLGGGDFFLLAAGAQPDCLVCDTALYHESGPPVELADLLTHSLPHLLLEGGMAQRGAKAIATDQK